MKKMTWTHFWLENRSEWPDFDRSVTITYQVSDWYLKTRAKSPENFSLAGKSAELPLPSVLSAMKLDIAQPWRKSLEVKTLTIEVCEKIWGLYIIFEAMNT